MVLCLLTYKHFDSRKNPLRLFKWLCGSMENWEHLPFDLIKDFAYGTVSLDEVQLHHCTGCEECSKAVRAGKAVCRLAKDARERGRQDFVIGEYTIFVFFMYPLRSSLPPLGKAGKRCWSDHTATLRIVEIGEKCPARRGFDGGSTITCSCLGLSMCKVAIGAQPLLAQ
jgi:hypothetical protein